MMKVELYTFEEFRDKVNTWITNNSSFRPFILFDTFLGADMYCGEFKNLAKWNKTKFGDIKVKKDCSEFWCIVYHDTPHVFCFSFDNESAVWRSSIKSIAEYPKRKIKERK